MIRLLWPTVRPEIMKRTYKHWINTALKPGRITVKIAVNIEKHRNQLTEFNDVMVIGNKRRGPAYATSKLAKAIEGKPRDIIILVSDDFYSPPKWDIWLDKQFKNFSGALMVRDAWQQGGCVTIPIMTYRCLLKLNRIIYHPSYTWQFSDEELYHNLRGLKMLRNLRDKKHPLFEHKHWCNGKRKFDGNDTFGTKSGGVDHKNFKRRMRLKIQERLK